MRLLALLIVTLFSFGFHAQEKRLALVIGNANYDKGKLNNPVNDALLMSKTLKELGFEVILDTNIATLNDFNETVRKFGEKRDNYDVGFIYYAGHGVQISDVNYLLATKEEYLSEYDVEDKALSVQKIMRHLTDRTDEVNVLILDACRDNPFEQNWNPKARSTEGGRGLAKISAPTGSLIAYSTDAGNTAADGENGNSLYCLSLTKNMVIENVTLDQVFRNVRAEVLSNSNGRQRPVEASQLTGDAFYLKKSTYTDKYIQIDSLIDAEKYIQAMNIASEILALDKTNKGALLRKSRCRYNLDLEKYDLEELIQAKQLYPEDAEVYFYFARYYNHKENGNEAMKAINKAIEIDSLQSEYHELRGTINSDLILNNEEALKDFNNAVRISPLSPEYLFVRAWFYADYTNQTDKALDDMNKGILMKPSDPNFYYDRGYLFDDYLNNNVLALNDYNKSLELDSNFVDAFNAKGLLLIEEGKFDLAIETFEKGIAVEAADPSAVARCYSNRALVLADLGNLDEALFDHNKSIELDPTNGTNYYSRGNFYADYEVDFTKAHLDFNTAIKISPKDPDFYFRRAILYKNHSEIEKAIEDFNQVLILDPDNIDAINWIGVIYMESNQTNIAIEFYEKGIKKAKENPISAAFCYRNRAKIFEEQGKFLEAEKDYSMAIELDSNNPERYLDRSLFYYFSLNDVLKALKDINIAIIDLEPNESKYYYFRGLYLSTYLKKDALGDFEKALELDPKDVDVIIEIGSLYEEEEKWDLAIEIYEKGIALESSDQVGAARCYNARGLVFALKGKSTDALDDLNKSIDLDPTNPEFYYNRAQFYLDYEYDIYKALADYNKCLEQRPDDLDFLYARGLLYKLEYNNNEKALIDWERLLKIDSTYINAINALGVLFKEEGKFDLAIQQYEKGIRLKDVNPISAAFCYSNKASIQAIQGENLKALDNYSRAIFLDPQNPDRYYYRANFLVDYLGNYKMAEDDYTEAIKLDPMNIELYYARGILYDDYLDNNKKALLDYEKMLDIDSLDIDAINGIGLIYEEEEKWDLAQKQYEKGILLEELNPSAASFSYNKRADLFVKKEKLEEALSDFSKAIELDPLNGINYYNRGYFFEIVKNDYSRALLDYSMAIYLEPEDLDFLHDRGLLYSKFSENDKAKVDLLKTLEIDSTYSKAFNTLGNIYDEEGDAEKALEYFQRGIDSESIDRNDKAYCYSNKGRINAKLGLFEIAETAYNGAILTEPENSEWYSDLASFHNTYSGNYKESLSNINKAIKLDPNVAYYYIIRSYIYFLLDDKKSQLKDINTAIELEPDVPDWYCERGLYFEQNGEIDTAMKEFDFGFTLDSTYYMSLIYKAKAQININDYEAAINTLNNVIEIDPNDPESYFLKGQIYEDLQDTTKAIINYSLSQGKLENYDYYISNNIGLDMNIGEYYVILGDFYSKLGEKEIMCEYYNKASSSLANEYEFRYQDFKKTLQEKLNQYCNH